jgi:hypothetical protein
MNLRILSMNFLSKIFIYTFIFALLNSFILSKTINTKENGNLSKRLGITLNQDTVTISGLSSGGYMAGQFHIAHSKHIKNVAIFSAGPYYCSLGDFDKISKDCMANPENLDLNLLVNIAKEFSDLKLNDDLAYLKDAKVYNFMGLKDTRVLPGVSQKLDEFYQIFDAKVMNEVVEDSQHAFPTDNPENNKCDYLGFPFINNCEINGAYNALKYITSDFKKNKFDAFEKLDNYREILKNSKIKLENLIEINQSQYFNYENISMNEKAFVYIPDNCKNKQNVCDLHVAFHGCRQTLDHIQMSFIEKTGYLQVAEIFDFVLLFPQAKLSEDIPFNPNGCWDFWGYNTSLKISSHEDGDKKYFSTKKGKQIAAVWNIINDLVPIENE